MANDKLTLLRREIVLDAASQFLPGSVLMVRNMMSSVSKSPISRSALAVCLSLALFGCGTGDDAANGNGDDAALLDDANDPAMKGALEEQILVDPDLTDQSNQNAVLGKGDDGALPSASVPSNSAAVGKAAADKEFAGKKMLSAPKPKTVSAEECTDCSQGATLGAKAEMQQRGKGTCDAKLTYAMSWAAKMPSEFRVYPRANVKEAAGVDGGLCDIRVVNFTTPVALKNVVDYYYTKARRGGYSAEYQLRDGEHVLGGTNDADDGAYVIFMRNMANGGTEVDIVANNGR